MKWIRNRCRHQRLGRRCCCRRSARRRIDHLAVGDGKPAELAIQAPLPNGRARALGTRRARVRVWASREERTAHQPPASRSSTISICAPAAKERYRLESCEPVEDHACCAIASLLVSCCTILGAMVTTQPAWLSCLSQNLRRGPSSATAAARRELGGAPRWQVAMRGVSYGSDKFPRQVCA